MHDLLEDTMRTETTLLLTLALLAAGCGDKGDDTGTAGDGGAMDGGAAGDGGSATTGTWADVEADLSGSCAFSGCHATGDQFPDLSAGNAYDSIVDVESQQAPGEILVIPGDADGSYLVRKVEGAKGITGNPMPQGSDTWDADSVATLRAWIDAGANP
ncbi:MAG: hypothetical protein D6798_10110 [Deltaproteobacteria bacterium]|nr:MAG: hypothetical protein D6798_10110 [Deltaproteobacteria bacterium]